MFIGGVFSSAALLESLVERSRLFDGPLGDGPLGDGRCTNGERGGDGSFVAPDAAPIEPHAAAVIASARGASARGASALASAAAFAAARRAWAARHSSLQ